MKNIVLILSILVLHFFTVSAFAQGGLDTRGGGHVVKKHGRFYLLDLMEANIEKETWIGKFQDPSVAAVIKNKNSKFSSVANLISKKVQDIKQRDPILASAILKTFQIYNWVFTAEQLFQTNPDDLSAQLKIYQGAVRQGYGIYISQSKWEAMPLAHRAALVIHEALMALNRQGFPESRIRQLVALLFHPQFKFFDSKKLLPYLQGSLPNVGDLSSVDSCNKFFPAMYCRQRGENVKILYSKKTDTIFPFFEGFSRFDGANYSAQWSNVDENHNYNWICGIGVSADRVAVMSISVKVSFLQPSGADSEIPAKLNWEYTKVSVVGPFALNHTSVGACKRDLRNDPIIKKIEDVLYSFSLFI